MSAAVGQTGNPIPRRFRRRVSPFRAGALALLLVAIASYLAFTKQLPWRQPFEFNAVFQTSTNIALNSPVRIAGVNVGEVTKVGHQENSDLAVVTMEMKETGLPIHEDATLKIRPRLFLEGNFFVDLRPGTPERPAIEDGDTVSVTQTATPVQLDEVLTALQSDTRQDLKNTLEGLGTAFTHEPTPAEDVGQDPDVKGESAAKALNDSLNYSGPALRNATVVNEALLGTEPHDLSKLIKGLQKVFAALDRNEEQLKDFITNFNATMAIFASRESSLRATIRLLAPTVEKAHAALTHLDQSLPELAGFARDILPGVRETPATIAAAMPWIAQARRLFSSVELGGFARELRPAIANFAKLVDESIGLYTQIDLTSRCFTDVILPTGDVALKDGPATTGAPNYKEFWYTMVGLSGEAQGFDGNGEYVRVGTGGGDTNISTTKLPGRPADANQLFGNAIVPPLGTRPPRPAKKPPYKPDFPCHKNQRPDLNGPAAAAGPPDRVVGRSP